MDEARVAAIRARFNSLESLRNAHGPIPILHRGVALAGIAETGPSLPLIKNPAEALREEIHRAAGGLFAWNGES